MEEVIYERANVSNSEDPMGCSSVKSQFDDDLEENQDIPEDDAKAKIRNDSSVSVARNVVPVGVTKAVADEAVLQ